MTEMTECEKEIIALKMRINWLQGERDFYREERDEARRNMCFAEAAELSFGPNGVPYSTSVAHEIAKSYGWDCFDNFEENTNGTNG